MFVNRLEFSLLIGQSDISASISICIYRPSQFRCYIEWNKAVKDRLTHCIKLLDRNFHNFQKLAYGVFSSESFVLGKTFLPLDNHSFIFISQMKIKYGTTQTNVYLSGLTSSKQIANWHVKIMLMRRNYLLEYSTINITHRS